MEFKGVEKGSSVGSAEYNLEIIKFYDPQESFSSKITSFSSNEVLLTDKD